MNSGLGHISCSLNLPCKVIEYLSHMTTAPHALGPDRHGYDEPDWFASKMLACQNMGKLTNFDTHLVEGQKSSPLSQMLF